MKIIRGPPRVQCVWETSRFSSSRSRRTTRARLAEFCFLSAIFGAFIIFLIIEPLYKNASLKIQPRNNKLREIAGKKPMYI